MRIWRFTPVNSAGAGLGKVLQTGLGSGGAVVRLPGRADTRGVGGFRGHCLGQCSMRGLTAGPAPCKGALALPFRILPAYVPRTQRVRLGAEGGAVPEVRIRKKTSGRILSLLLAPRTVICPPYVTGRSSVALFVRDGKGGTRATTSV